MSMKLGERVLYIPEVRQSILHLLPDSDLRAMMSINYDLFNDCASRLYSKVDLPNVTQRTLFRLSVSFTDRRVSTAP